MKQIFTTALLALSVITHAQDSLKVDTLKAVQVIGVSTTAQQPISQTRFNCQEYSFLNNQTDPFFVLQKATPSIYAQSDNGQENGYSYMRLRGLDQTRINYNLNGVPLNEMEDQGLYFSNIPGFYNYLSAITVERGIGTSKYGNTSVAGSVDMETRSLSEHTFELTTNLANTYNNRFANAYYGSGITKSGLSFQLGTSYLYNEGFKDHSGNIGGSLYYCLGYTKNKNIFKLYGVSGITRNELAFYGVPMNLIDSNYKTNLNSTTDRDTFQQNLVCLNWVNFANSKAKFNTTVYFDNVKGTYNTAGVLFGVTSYQFGAMSNMVLENAHNTTNIGINTNIYTRKHFGYDNNGYYDYPQNCQYYSNTGNKKDLIGYVKGLNKHEYIDLFYDLQARAVWFDATDSKTYNWLFLNPKVGLKTHQGNNNVYINFGLTQREPTRTDMLQNIIQSDTAYRFGNPDNTRFFKNDTVNLHPELVYDVEMGDNFHIENVDVNLNVYGMVINHEYVATGIIDPYSGFMNKKEVQSTSRIGIESNIKVRMNRFMFLFNVNMQHSNLTLSNTDGGYTIPFTPTFIGSAGLVYKSKYFDVGALEQSVSSMVMSLDNQNIQSTPYTITNLFADVKYKVVSLSFKLNNVFNDKYYIPAGMAGVPTFYVGQLMNYTLALKIKI